MANVNTNKEAKDEKNEIPKDMPMVPYVVYEMAERRHEKREVRHWIFHAILAVVILASVLAFVWLWNQYDTVSTIEATGVYTLVDSSGNVISANIPTDKIPDILKLLEENNGNSQGK